MRIKNNGQTEISPVSIYYNTYAWNSTLLLLLEDLLVVEVVFFIFEDVAISTATLTRTRRDASKKLTGSQLFNDFLLVDDGLLSLFKLGNHRLALSLHLGKVIQNNFALTDNLAGVVLFEPGLEGRSIDGNNTTLHDGVGTHEFVVGSVVDNVQDLGLGGESYLLFPERKILNSYLHQPRRKYRSPNEWHGA